MLKKAKYILPAATETSSNATNTEFVKEESYPCTSEGCAKDSHLREWLKKHAKVHDQEGQKCQRIRKRPINELETAFKERRRHFDGLQRLCTAATRVRCYECNEFKRHVNLMLQEITL